MRIRLLVTGTYIALVGLVLLAGTGRAGALMIDEFSTDQTVLWLGGPGSTGSQVSGAEILGGERDMEVTLVSNIGVVMAASGGTLNYAHAFNSEATGLIVWDGPDGAATLDPTGLGGVDFTAGGEDKIVIPLLLSNLAAPITLTAYTDGANYSTAMLSLPGNVPPQTRLSVFFTDFSAAAGAGADFTNIGAFSLYIDGSSTPGLVAGFESLVPEPSTATLLLFGILGIVTIRRCGWIP
jgi:hypothetical protein